MIFFPDLLKRTCTNRVHSGTMRNDKKPGLPLREIFAFIPSMKRKTAAPDGALPRRISDKIRKMRVNTNPRRAWERP